MAYDRAQWFEYDWQVEGEPACFAVDLALADVPRSERPLLLYVSCQSKKSSAQRLSAFETTRAEALCAKVKKALGALYAGYIEMEAQRQYYFYIHNAGEFRQAEALADKEPFLACRAGFAPEEDWLTYDSLLYPDAAKLQTERNRELIGLMRKNGDCINTVRRVTFTLFFSTEHIMLMFAEQARLSGFAVAGPVYAPEREFAYGSAVVRISTLDKREIDGLTTRVIRLAEQFGGELDQWDAPVIRRGGPLMQQN